VLTESSWKEKRKGTYWFHVLFLGLAGVLFVSYVYFCTIWAGMPRYCFTEVILALHHNVLHGTLASVLIWTPSLFYFAFYNDLESTAEYIILCFKFISSFYLSVYTSVFSCFSMVWPKNSVFSSRCTWRGALSDWCCSH